MKANSLIVILLASGKSTRMQHSTAKPFLKINNETIIEKSLNALLNNENIGYILPVIKHEDAKLFEVILSDITHHNDNHQKKILPYCLGGIERKDSVLNALVALKDINPHMVLIHDCARPLINNEIINNIISNIKPHCGVVPALAITDTLKKVNNNYINEDINRDNLYSIQTPQGFIYKEILDSYQKHQHLLLTDDSSYYIKNNYQVKIVEGSPLLHKITYQKDIKFMENMANNLPLFKVGLGQDIHKFETQHPRDLILGGIKIPAKYGLQGHSDADVVIHSLVDAILGGLACGDIGDYFPPNENKWKNASSTIFLELANNLLKEKNTTIVNIDITILAEEPKISPYKKQMINNLANILQIDASNINIKATTMETLGSIGRKEGIFSTAVVSLMVLNN